MLVGWGWVKEFVRDVIEITRTRPPWLPMPRPKPIHTIVVVVVIVAVTAAAPTTTGTTPVQHRRIRCVRQLQNRLSQTIRHLNMSLPPPIVRSRPPIRPPIPSATRDELVIILSLSTQPRGIRQRITCIDYRFGERGVDVVRPCKSAVHEYTCGVHAAGCTDEKRGSLEVGIVPVGGLDVATERGSPCQEERRVVFGCICIAIQRNVQRDIARHNFRSMSCRKNRAGLTYGRSLLPTVLVGNHCLRCKEIRLR